MDTLQIDDLKKITDFYIDLYGKCRELLISCAYFRNPNDIKAEKIIKKWAFFKAVNYSFELALIIELCKLFQKNKFTQKFNINKFIDVLTTNHKYLSYKDKLSLEIIKKWHGKLESDEAKINIDYIGNLRNQFYAHTDKIDGYFLEWINIDFDRIEYLLSILEEIIVDIYAEVYDCELFLDSNFINSRSIVNIVIERNEFKVKYSDLIDKSRT